ncbi:hypothetical protein FIBSPDRAFT_862304 [Athelia psychrophila]|uniref:Uncharacterized protein n=1 Tax=Athelia psychrophila TaxID=1759441 RepID=A0A166IH75_9AGAM|nr:hypothetical protein FIBSPDRAFT_862304 [Fibularhizoctonia sp. CBS 109695]
MVRDAFASVLLCLGMRLFLRCAIQKSTLHLKLAFSVDGKWGMGRNERTGKQK